MSVPLHQFWVPCMQVLTKRIKFSTTYNFSLIFLCALFGTENPHTHTQMLICAFIQLRPEGLVMSNEFWWDSLNTDICSWAYHSSTVYLLTSNRQCEINWAMVVKTAEILSKQFCLQAFASTKHKFPTQDLCHHVQKAETYSLLTHSLNTGKGIQYH